MKLKYFEDFILENIFNKRGKDKMVGDKILVFNEETDKKEYFLLISDPMKLNTILEDDPFGEDLDMDDECDYKAKALNKVGKEVWIFRDSKTKEWFHQE